MNLKSKNLELTFFLETLILKLANVQYLHNLRH